MSEQKPGVVPVQVKSNLTHKEESAYRAHLRANEPPLSPTLQQELFELYLKGSTLEEISRINKAIRLGPIVRAAVEGDWYGRRAVYVQGLLDGLRARVQQAQAEAVGFMSDYLAVAHKMFGDKMKRYLQTGDESELGDLKPTSITHYKIVLEMLLKATGQGETKNSTVKVDVVHQHEVPAFMNAPLTPEQAMQAVFALHGVQTPEDDKDG